MNDLQEQVIKFTELHKKTYGELPEVDLVNLFKMLSDDERKEQLKSINYSKLLMAGSSKKENDDLIGSDRRSEPIESRVTKGRFATFVQQDKKKEPKKVAIMIIDVETSGSSTKKNGLISVGYFVGDTFGNKIAKKRIGFDYIKEGKQMEKRCHEQFWSKNQDKLNTFSKESKEAKIAIKEFMTDVDAFEEKYDLRIMSDNPKFDISFIDCYLEVYLDRMPLDYCKDQSTYRAIYDTESYMRGLLGEGFNKMWLDDKEIIEKTGLIVDGKKDHYPDNDAEYIYNFLIAMKRRFVVD